MHPIMTEAIVEQYQAERRRLAEQHRLARTHRVTHGATRSARWRARRMLRRALPIAARG